MKDNSIYRDIAKRTGGDIYVGVVGPVRSGKSTFIRRFLDTVVMPNIADEYDRERTLDQIPQSAGGRTVMTTEPKFVPDESVRITVGDETELNVKLIDCVGYMIDGAIGDEEGGFTRMITTPWSEEPMPFREAAELGTSKVIGEHSTIGILVTTDGTIGEIPRESYIPSEERVARELNELGKPFAIVLNSATPDSEESRALALELEEKYGAPTALISCQEMNADDVREILGLVLEKFPVKRLSFHIPRWCCALPGDHPLRGKILGTIESFSEEVSCLGDISRLARDGGDVVATSLDAGEGAGELNLPISEEVWYETISEICDIEIKDEEKLFSTLMELSEIRKKYAKVASALAELESGGYGIMIPSTAEMSLEEPKLVKQASGWGVRVTAYADTVHMIKVGMRTDVCPVIGSKEQSEEVVRFLSEEYEDNPDGIWDSNMFGRSLYDLVSDGMAEKLRSLPDESRVKLGETLEKVINEGAGGLLCVIL